MISTEELQETLNIKLAEEVAAEIANTFETRANNENLELEFRIPAGQGRMEGTLDGPNTWFKFDAEEGTTLARVRDIIVDVFSEDFDLNDGKASARMDARRNIIDGFVDQVRTVLNSGQFHEEIAGTIRRVCLQNIPEEIHPLDVIRFLEIEIGDGNPDEVLLIIEKKALVDSATGQFITPPVSVQEVLHEEHRETGKDFNQIIEEKKAAGDERFDLVTGARTVRYAFEVHCDIAVDYSLAERSDVPKPRIAQT